MNAKLAKGIRKATDYKNQSATPGVIDFPGVSKKIYQHPVMMRNKNGRLTTRSCPVWYARYRNTSIPSAYGPVQEMVVKTAVTGPDDLLGVTRLEPKVELVPVAKPARLSTDCPKGRYRVAKKFVKRFGVDALANATAVTA